MNTRTTVNPRYSLTLPEWANNHLELWAERTGQTKGGLTTMLVVRALRESILNGEAPALINLDTVTKEQREQLDEAIDLLVKHMGISRGEAVNLLYKAQQSEGDSDV